MSGAGIGERGLELIKEFEGFSSEAYPDPIHGWKVPTIGYGTTIYPNSEKVKQGDTISEALAVRHLERHVNEVCTPQLVKIPTWQQMSQNQRDAIYSFAYNVGEHFYGGLGFASITALCDTPSRWTDADWIKEQFCKYRNPGTNAEIGLLRRRQAEADLFLSL